MLIFPLLFEGERSDKERALLSPSQEMYEYSESLEKSLCSAVSEMVDSDQVSVMITLEGTFENVYASDASINEAVTADKTDMRSEKQLVLTGGNNAQTPIIIKKIPPKVKGAVIVCKNGNDPQVKSSVAALAATALNISETKIYVTGGK